MITRWATLAALWGRPARLSGDPEHGGQTVRIGGKAGSACDGASVLPNYSAPRQCEIVASEPAAAGVYWTKHHYSQPEDAGENCSCDMLSQIPRLETSPVGGI
jgi:hypothetical protein